MAGRGGSFLGLSGSRDRLLLILLFLSNSFTLLFLYGPGSLMDVSPPSTQSAGVSSFRFSNVTQRTFSRGHGLQGFVFFSAYRINSTDFVVLGLAPLMLHHMLDSRFCWWWPSKDEEEAVQGSIAIEYPGEAHQKQYEVIMLFCHLRRPTPPREGGHLTVLVDKEEIIVYGEPAKNTLPHKPPGVYSSNISYCSQPIYGDFNQQRVVEWVEYHRVGHGVDRFHLYDVGGAAESLLTILKPYIGDDVMTLTDISEVRQYDNWYAQVLAMNDCVYRSLYASKWVLFLDLDEYLYVDPAKGNLLSLLSLHEGKAWVSFGSEFFFTKMCSHSFNVSASANASLVERLALKRWEVERMIFKQSDTHCVAPEKYESRYFCLGYDGHRKYVADPRLIQIAGIHSVTKPWTRGIDLDAREIHLNHYRGLNTNYIVSCSQYIHDTDWIPKSWRRDFSLSREALRIRFQTLRASLAKQKRLTTSILNASLAEFEQQMGTWIMVPPGPP